ncbi:hypothetical protein Ocin01_03280, partial [Orchesella cincta]
MPSQPVSAMSSKLCRQVSIESPGPLLKDCVFSFDVPVPDVPPTGARIRVECAGACYRLRKENTSGGGSGAPGQSLSHYGVRDAALFPGYEVAGIVEAIGMRCH